MPIEGAVNFPSSCGLATTQFVASFAKPTIASESFRLSLSRQPRQTVAPTSNVETTLDDMVVLRSTNQSYVDDVLAVVTQNAGNFDSVQLSSETPGVITGGGNSRDSLVFTYSSSGTARVRAVGRGGLTQLAAVNTTAGTGFNTDVFNRWSDGSLAKHLVSQFLARAQVDKTVSIFSEQNHLSPISYKRNTSCVLYDVDLSCFSPWNSTGGQQRAGTLITPRHALFAQHFPISVGATVRFVRQLPSDSGSLPYVDRTVVSVQGADSSSTDWQVARLDSDVPYAFAKVLPANTANKLSMIQAGRSKIPNQPVLPMWYTTQDKVIIMVGLGLSSTNAWNVSGYDINVDGLSSKQSFSWLRGVPPVETRVGDSGSPTFLLVNGELVLVGVLFSGSGGTHTGYQAGHDALNSAISTLGPSGYSITPVDVSAFATY